jgi:hypothetical protein
MGLSSLAAKATRALSATSLAAVSLSPGVSGDPTNSANLSPAKNEEHDSGQPTDDEREETSDNEVSVTMDPNLDMVRLGTNMPCW